MNNRSPEGLIPQDQVVAQKNKEVSGFIPGITDLHPEAAANIARALAETSATEPYNSSETLRKVIEAKEATRRK
jgi:hypothetical protein